MAGRPKLSLDTGLIEKLASIQCSNVEIAAILGCHPDTLRDNYSTNLDKGRQQGRMTLRRKQWDTAMNGNVTMLIWLGKQYLEQTDKVQDVPADEDRPLKELSDTELLAIVTKAAPKPKNKGNG